MIGLLAAYTSMAFRAIAQPSQTRETAASMISSMFKLYADAKSVSGLIRLVQTAQNSSVEIDTSIAYERPSKFFLDQRQSDGQVADAIAVSDGIQFSYTPPPKMFPKPDRMLESVHPAPKVTLSISEMYTAIDQSLIDKSFALDAVVARPQDLRTLAGQLASFTLMGKTTVRGITTNLISGQWRADAAHPVSGSFELYLSDSGDLIRYVQKRTFTVSQKALLSRKLPIDSMQNGVEVVSTWDADLKVDKPVDKSVFKLR